jgi:ATP-binding protein involved in chromosome partitioning
MAEESNGLEAQVMEQLSTVIEPELHRDLVTLNMIRDLKIDGDNVTFTIMLTTPACPLKDVMETQSREAVLRVEGINSATINFDADVPANSRIMGQLNLPLKSMVAVSSGKGGVGKSTVAVNMAVALAQSGASVGLLDADILGPNIPMMMGVDRIPPPVNQRLVPANAYGVKLMSMGFLVEADQPLVWRGPMLHSAIRQFFTDVDWGPLDYMVVDLPPGTGDAQLSLAQSVPLTGAVIVTQPQEVALGDALRGLAMFEQLQVPIIGIVENMSGELFGQGGGETLAEQRSVPFLGSVPMETEVRIGGDGGTPIVVSHPESAAATALKSISQEVAARVSVITIEQDQNIIPLTTVE